MKVFNFPTGEVHCNLSEGTERLIVPMQDNLNDYLMAVFMACETNSRLLHRRSAHYPGFRLVLPYLPYSRQDRPTSINEPFSLKVIGNLLNTFKLDQVVTLDVHSDAAFGCINNLVNIPVDVVWGSKIWQHTEHENGSTTSHSALGNIGTKTLIIPDQGAAKRLGEFSKKFAGTAMAIKERDTATGHLTFKGLIGDVTGKNCMIVDDICDGGMTFILLANSLYEHGAASVELMVTHGVFSKNLTPLFNAGIRHIYTTDSIPMKNRAGEPDETYELYRGAAYLTVAPIKEILSEYFARN